MSWKAGIIAGGIIVILLAGSNLVTWKLTSVSYYKDGQDSVIQDSTTVTSDTVWLASEPLIKYEWIFVDVADVDTVNEGVTYSTHIDTTVIINKDTVAIINQDISLTEGIFQTLMKIEIRPVEKIINVIKTEFRTVIKEIPSDPPFYNTWITGFISGIILFLSLVIFI
jgi:hypothetical protein